MSGQWVDPSQRVIPGVVMNKMIIKYGFEKK